MSLDLIFEIGAEELPAGFLQPAMASLASQWNDLASAARLTFGDVQTYATPRRLALLVRGVSERTPDVEERAEGPALAQAFDANGVPTKAAEGFARRFGLTVDQLQRAQTPQGERLVALRREPGKRAFELLSPILTRLISEIPFKKPKMRWGHGDQTFPRPVRWIVAVLGGEVVPVQYGGVSSGGLSSGHRFLAPQGIELRRCDSYVSQLRDARVLADWAERRAAVVREIDRVAAENGGRRVDDDDLVDTITGLVEWPSGVWGTFAPDALDMPREVLISEMRGHQKYASVESAQGTLLPGFVAVANTPVRDVAVSRKGYERVLRARLADARYFFDEDRTRRLDSRVSDLGRVTFQEKLGSIGDKVERMGQVAAALAQRVGGVDSSHLARAVFLSKADLTTGMVGEFPELQGVMGREYALHDGEAAAVSTAIFEHYLPRGASDILPSTRLGALVGLADRLDTITGIFAIGRGPTGANDPFALRRACLGIIRVLIQHDLHVSLAESVDAALAQHQKRLSALPAPTPTAGNKAGKGKSDALPSTDEVRTQVLEFFRARLKAAWSEESPVDVVEAVLSAGFDDVADAAARVKAVTALHATEGFLPLATAFGRVSNIVEKQAAGIPEVELDASVLTEQAEKDLHAATVHARIAVEVARAQGDHAAALQAIAQIRPAVDAFFESVLVMAPDPTVKAVRLTLVRQVRGLFAPIADFARIQTRV